MDQPHHSSNPNSFQTKIEVLHHFHPKNSFYSTFILLLVFLVTPICAHNPTNQQNNIIFFNTPDQLGQSTKTLRILLQATKTYYSGTFFSTIPQPTLDSITVQQGETTLKFFISNKTEIQTQPSKSFVLNPFQFQTPTNPAIPQDTSIYQDYIARFRFYNPRYVSEQVLHCKIRINASIFVNETNNNNEYQQWEDDLGEDLQKNITQQTCLVGQNNSWSCKNTLLSYTTTWRNWDNETTTMIYVDYTMAVTYEDISNPQTIQIQFQITNARSLSLQQIKPVYFGLSLKAPLSYQTLRNADFHFIYPCNCNLPKWMWFHHEEENKCMYLFNKEVGNGQKLSLVTVSFCVISDLTIGTSFAFNAYSTEVWAYCMQNALNRIGFIAITAAYVVLYVVYDVHILNKVIIGHIQSRNLPIQDLMRFIKKAFIAFFLFFLLAYEAVVFMESYFGFEWWYPILMTIFILPPQIIRNSRKGFGGEGLYLSYIGYLASRYLIYIYQKCCPSNVYNMKPNPGVGLAIFILLIVQVIVLGCQNVYGSRFFIPVKWRPGYFNYVYKGSLEAINDRDCTVCLQDLANDTQDAIISSSSQNIDQKPSIISEQNDQGNLRSALKKKSKVYRTPCQHFFHPSCLKSWMTVKLQCPTCRTPLPAL